MEQHRKEFVSKLASQLQVLGLSEKIATSTVLAVPCNEPSPDEVGEDFARFREDLSRQVHPQVLSYIKEELESHLMEVTDLHVQETAELHARVTANDQEISGLIAFIAELKNRLLESDQKNADLTALLMAVTERLMAVEKILKNSNPSSGTGEPDSWVEMMESASLEEAASSPEQPDASASAECSSPPEEPEITFGFFPEESVDASVDASIDAVSSKEQPDDSASAAEAPATEDTNAGSMVLKPKPRTKKVHKKGNGGGRMYDEVTIQGETFLARGDIPSWKGLRSLSVGPKSLTKQEYARVLEKMEFALENGYIKEWQMEKFLKGCALWSNFDSRAYGSDLDSQGIPINFPKALDSYPEYKLKSSKYSQAFVSLNDCCPSCAKKKGKRVLVHWAQCPKCSLKEVLEAEETN